MHCHLCKAVDVPCCKPCWNPVISTCQVEASENDRTASCCRCCDAAGKSGVLETRGCSNHRHSGLPTDFLRIALVVPPSQCRTMILLHLPCKISHLKTCITQDQHSIHNCHALARQQVRPGQACILTQQIQSMLSVPCHCTRVPGHPRQSSQAGSSKPKRRLQGICLSLDIKARSSRQSWETLLPLPVLVPDLLHMPFG